MSISAGASASNRLSIKDIYRQFQIGAVSTPTVEDLDNQQFTPDGAILNKDFRWIENMYMYYLCVSVHILFEYLGATAFLITVLDFTLLNSSFQSQLNVDMHFITSISFLIELSLNRMTVYIDHFRFMAYWFILYTVVIWATTYTNATGLNDWPYDFLSTDTTTSFLWYEIIIVATIIFYCIWTLMSHLKFKYILSKQNP